MLSIMQKYRFSWFEKLILLSLLLFCCFTFLLFCFQTITIQQFIKEVSSNIFTTAQQEVIFAKYLTLNKIHFLRVILSFFSVSIITFFLVYRNLIFQYFNELKIFLFAFKFSLDKALVIILLLSILIKVLILNYLPLHLDELFSYLFLSYKGFLVTLTYYPGPNNHVFYNLLSSCFAPFVSPFWAIRMPSLLVSVLLQIFLYQVFKSKTSRFQTIIISLIPIFSESLLVFSISGRGYILSLFLGVIGVYSLIFSRNKHLIFNKINAVFCFSLMLFSLPTMIMPFLGFLIYVLFFNELNIKQVFKFLISTGIITMILYLPILIISGPNSLFANAWLTQSLSFSEFIRQFPAKISAYFDFIFPTYSYSHLLWIPVLVWLWKGKKEDYFVLIQFLLAFVWIVFKKQFPFERVYLYLHFLFLMYLAYKLNTSYLLLILVVLLLTRFAFSIPETLQYINRENAHIKYLSTLLSQNLKSKVIKCKEEKDSYLLQMIQSDQKNAIPITWNQDLNGEFKFVK